MIKEQSESTDEQTKMTSPISTINHMHQQLTTTTTNNIPFVITNRWKQVSLQGLDVTLRDNKVKPSNSSTTQRVNLTFSLNSFSYRRDPFFSASRFVGQQQHCIRIRCIHRPRWTIQSLWEILVGKDRTSRTSRRWANPFSIHRMCLWPTILSISSPIHLISDNILQVNSIVWKPARRFSSSRFRRTTN